MPTTMITINTKAEGDGKTQTVVHSHPRRHNHRQTRPDIDPRLEPFLRALAELIARQVLYELEENNTNARSPGEGRDLRP